MSMVMIYDWYLARKVKNHESDTPDHVVVVITETDLFRKRGMETLDEFFNWCEELGIGRVSVYVSLIDSSEAVTSRIKDDLETLKTPVEIHDANGENGRKRVGNSNGYEISLGLQGRNEFIHALRNVAKDVDEGKLDLEQIDESVIEDNLIFDGEPDVIIKTGGEHLSNFMIWQSVYSELHFADYNWQNLRKRDFLRTIRDFQERERRYGR